MAYWNYQTRTLDRNSTLKKKRKRFEKTLSDHFCTPLMDKSREVGAKVHVFRRRFQSKTQSLSPVFPKCREVTSHLTQIGRLSESLQMCCQQDNFMVVNQKVVKVVSIDNQKVLITTTQRMCCSLYWKLPINRFYIK